MNGCSDALRARATDVLARINKTEDFNCDSAYEERLAVAEVNTSE